MKETTLSALSLCFERWRQTFDYSWKNLGKKKEFPYNFAAGLLGESERKNIAKMSDNIIGSSDYNIHHFISYAKWQ